jgi:hypothetical protein
MPSSVINSDDGVISGTSGLKSSGGDDGVLVFQSKGTETARINTDKQIVAAAGTASLPALTTTGDVNTGIFFPAADTIAFAEGGAEAMRIDSSGRVGIGTTSPAVALEVIGTTTSGLRLKSIATASNGFNIFNNSSTDTASLINHFDGPMVFGTNNTERMRITNTGMLAINTTTAVSGNTSAKLVVKGASDADVGEIQVASNGTLAFDFRNSSGTQAGSITVNASSVAYNTSSDYRLKENILPMTGALATVAQLKPCIYTWKVDGSAGQGFIAHELQEVIPDCVTGEKDATEIRQVEVSPAIPATFDDDGNELTPAIEAVYEEREVPKYQGVDTSFLVATLTAAIQELSAKNDALEARLSALEQA